MSTVSDEAAVLAANAAFYLAFNQRDIPGMDDLWTRQQHATCIHPNGQLLTGRAAVLESWHAILSNPTQARIVAAADRALVSGDLALVVGRELVSGSAIAASNMFVREDDVWRMLHHHGSMVLIAESSE